MMNLISKNKFVRVSEGIIPFSVFIIGLQIFNLTVTFRKPLIRVLQSLNPFNSKIHADSDM